MKNFVDCHLHTTFSPDGVQTPVALIDKAVEKGLRFIAVTDHIDLDSGSNAQFTCHINLDKYFEELNYLRRAFKDKIEIAIGIELGYTDKSKKELADYIAGYPFEYIINSIHTVNNEDCYWPKFFYERTKKRAYGEYLTCVEKSLDAPYPFDAIGHFGYITRNATYLDNRMLCEDFPQIQRILKKIADKNLILEVNTSVCTAPSVTLPDTEILRLFKQVGGKYVTLASDAHNIDKIAHNFDKAVAAIKNAGFDTISYKQNGCIKSVEI